MNYQSPKYYRLSNEGGIQILRGRCNVRLHCLLLLSTVDCMCYSIKNDVSCMLTYEVTVII